MTELIPYAWPFVLLMGAVHSLVLGGMLMRNRAEPRRARQCLAWLSMVMALLMTLHSLSLLEVPLPLGVGGTVGALWFMVGPLFYGYVRFLLPGRDRWEPEDAIHVVPFLYQLVMVAWFFRLTAEAQADVAQAMAWIRSEYLVLFLLQSAVYAVATVGLVRRYARQYRMEAAGAVAVHLDVIQRALLIFVIYVAITGINTAQLFVTGGYWQWLDNIVPLMLSVMAWMLSYMLLRHPALVLPELAWPAPVATPAAPTPELIAHANSLRHVMTEQRLYLNPDLRLGDLATALGLSERMLSQVLSEAMRQSFYDVVNHYRVAAVRQRLADSRSAHLTLLAVAMECGFSSKASFNRVFKKQTGLTPSVYRAHAQHVKGDGRQAPLDAVEVHVRLPAERVSSV
ncbi:MAG: helix-turn-helix transcriptional regulator [Bacteroidota bacterium]